MFGREATMYRLAVIEGKIDKLLAEFSLVDRLIAMNSELHEKLMARSLPEYAEYKTNDVISNKVDEDSSEQDFVGGIVDEA